MQPDALDLVRRIVDALEACQTPEGQINPYAFFGHHNLSNWLNDAKAARAQTKQQKD